MRTVFLDTSSIVAAVNSGDAYHVKAKQIFQQLAEENVILVVSLHSSVIIKKAEGRGGI